MLDAFTLGPLLIPTRPLSVIGAVVLAVFAVRRFARWLKLDAQGTQRTAERAAWVGVVGARAGFVMTNWSAFAEQPWTAVYLWQPGWLPLVGIACGALFVVATLARPGATRRKDTLKAIAGGYAVGALALATIVAMLVLLAPANTLRAEQKVPDFTLSDLNGDTVQLSDLAGRAVVLNFWATWCPPCIREMPLLDAVHKQWQARGLTVIGINLNEPASVVVPFVAAMKVDYPMWLDARPPRPAHDSVSDLYARFGGVGLPTTIIIDRNGVIFDRHVGELNRGLLEQWARQVLAR